MTSTPTRPVDDVVIAMKGLQDRNINIIAGMTVENKSKLIINVVYKIKRKEFPKVYIEETKFPKGKTVCKRRKI